VGALVAACEHLLIRRDAEGIGVLRG